MIGSHSLLLYVLCYMKFRRPNITQHCITMHPVPTAERYRLSHPRSKSHRLFTVWILLFCRYTVTVCLSVNTTIRRLPCAWKNLSARMPLGQMDKARYSKQLNAQASELSAKWNISSVWNAEMFCFPTKAFWPTHYEPNHVKVFTRRKYEHSLSFSLPLFPIDRFCI